MSVIVSFSQSVCLFVCQSVSLSVKQSISLLVCHSVSQSVSLSVIIQLKNIKTTF